MFVFLNGQFLPEAQALVPVADRGFLLGDGLFETMRVVNGKPFRIAQHLERLGRGASFLKIRLPFSAKELQQFAEQLIGKNQLPESVLRLTVTRGTADRGYAFNANSPATVVMTLHPAPPAEAVEWALVTSSYRVPAADPLAGFKTTSKILHVMARDEAKAEGADEALLVNTNGEVAEAVSGNLFWIFEDKVCTVPTGRGILPGITRAVVLEICESLGLATNKRVIKPEQLRRSTGLFLTQSVFGIVPIKSFDGDSVRPSPLVDQIAATYHEWLRRE